METCLAIDIGGTKLAAGLVDIQGRLSSDRSVPTPLSDDPEELFGEILGLTTPILGQADPHPAVCGVGCGGPMEPGGEAVSPLNIKGWSGFPLRRRLTESLGLPTFVDNDAKALALGEGWRGAAVGFSSFMAMVVSTGVGGGIVLNSRLLSGESGNAGHVGHVIVVPGGRRCPCGAKGCLEAEASGRAIAAITGHPASRAGRLMVERTGRLVGQAVACVANLLDLRLAVVGGSVALGFGEGFFAAAQREVDALARLEFSLGTRVIPAGLGPAGPLVGAGAIGWAGAGHQALPALP